MFAIRLDNSEKFVNLSWYFTRASVKVSATPKKYKTVAEAKKDILSIKKVLKEQQDSYLQYNVRRDKEYTMAVKALAKDKETLKELFELPYKDVYKQVDTIQKRIAKNEKIVVDSKDEKIANPTLKRVSNLLTADMSVVKVVTSLIGQ